MKSNNHAHQCSHVSHFYSDIKKYWAVVFITAMTLCFEVVGGWMSNSLALYSDALHIAVDLLSVILALCIEYAVAKRHEHLKNTIRGWGGIVSSFLLLVSIIPISVEAIERIFYPEALRPGNMIIFAFAGLIGNAISLWFLGHSHEKHVTHTSLTAHMISDMAQSLGVVVAGIIILATGWVVVDPLISISIVVLLLRITFRTFKQSARSLLRAKPS